MSKQDQGIPQPDAWWVFKNNPETGETGIFDEVNKAWDTKIEMGTIDQVSFWERPLSKKEWLVLETGTDPDKLSRLQRIAFEVKIRIPFLRRRMRKGTKYPF